MRQNVTGKQPNSRMCLICGLKNGHGLQTRFFELENGELAAFCTPRDEHQSYPGRLHGGITSALLDETIGRAIMIGQKDGVWGVTIEFTTTFRKPVPLNVELQVIGRITGRRNRVFEGSGELLLPNGEVAATGKGRYLQLPIDRIADFDPLAQEWRVVDEPEDRRWVDRP